MFAQQVEEFGEHGRGRSEGQAKPFKRLGASFVPVVSGMENRQNRSGVKESSGVHGALGFSIERAMNARYGALPRSVPKHARAASCKRRCSSSSSSAGYCDYALNAASQELLGFHRTLRSRALTQYERVKSKENYHRGLKF